MYNKFCLLLTLTVALASGCIRQEKKKAVTRKTIKVKTPIYAHKGVPFGILRIECSDCKFNYTVGKKQLSIDVKEGNQDRFIYPQRASVVRTEIISHEKQMIRILAINPNGDIISNELDSFAKGEIKNKDYPMTWKKKNTTLVNQVLPETTEEDTKSKI